MTAWRFIVLLSLLAPSAAFAEERVDAARRALIFVQRAEERIDDERYRAAQRDLKRALELLPDFPPAHIGMGHVAMRAQDYARALHHYEAAREGYKTLDGLQQDVAKLRYAHAQQRIEILQDRLNQRGIVLNSLVRAEIENEMLRLLAVEPPTEEKPLEAPPILHFFVGNALWGLGRHEDALAEWEHCRNLQPELGAMHKNLALGYWKCGQPERALESLRAARERGVPIETELEAKIQAELDADTSGD